MSVRARLWLAFMAVAVLLLVPVWYADVQLNELREMAVERRSQHATAEAALGAFRAGIADLDRELRAYLATLDPEMASVVRRAVRELRTQVARLDAAGYGAETRKLAADLDSLTTLNERIVEHVRAGNVDGATGVFQSAIQLETQMASEVADVMAAVDAASQNDFALAEEMSATAATTTLIATLTALLLALVISLWTTRALTVPMRRLAEAAGEVERGTFRAPEDLPYEREDEIGNLSRSFRAMTERLEELDRMKSEFMSVASHELKTPVSVIRAYAELLELQAGERMSDDQKAHLRSIIRQTDVMVRLISRLLNIGRLESGVYELEIAPVEVREILDELVMSFRVLAEEAGVQLRADMEDTAPETIHVDAELLQNEVLGNLLSNALRFTPEGGEIRLRAWRENSDVVFEVSDAGPGIPEDQRPYIFEKYYEGDRTHALGAGLGLAVAKEVAEAHGGRITLESQADDEGATFRVSLPVSSIVVG